MYYFCSIFTHSTSRIFLLLLKILPRDRHLGQDRLIRFLQLLDMRFQLLDPLQILRSSVLERLLLFHQLFSELLLVQFLSPAAVEVPVSHMIIEIFLGLLQDGLFFLGELEISTVPDLLPS